MHCTCDMRSTTSSSRKWGYTAYLRRLNPPLMFENRRMPNGTFEPSLGLCGVVGRTCEGSLYPIWLFSQFESLKSGKKVGESAPQRNHSIPIIDVTLTAVRGTLIALAEEERASDLLPSHVRRTRWRIWGRQSLPHGCQNVQDCPLAG